MTVTEKMINHTMKIAEITTNFVWEIFIFAKMKNVKLIRTHKRDIANHKEIGM